MIGRRSDSAPLTDDALPRLRLTCAVPHPNVLNRHAQYGRERRPRILRPVLAEDLAGSEAAFAEQMTRPYGPPLRPTTSISRRSTKPSAAISLDPGNPSS